VKMKRMILIYMILLIKWQKKIIFKMMMTMEILGMIWMKIQENRLHKLIDKKQMICQHLLRIKCIKYIKDLELKEWNLNWNLQVSYSWRRKNKKYNWEAMMKMMGFWEVYYHLLRVIRWYKVEGLDQWNKRKI